MVKLGILLIVVGLGSFILKMMGFDLTFENFMGHGQMLILIGMAALGAMLLLAGMMVR